MKKLMAVAALSATSLLVVGCGGKPKIPANTVAAAYVDLDKLVWNAAVDEIPDKDMRKEMQKAIDDFMKDHKKDIKAVDAQWALLAVTLPKEGFGIGSPKGTLVVKCDCEKKIPSADKSLKDLMPMFGLTRKGDEKGCDIYEGDVPVLGPSYIAVVEGKYVIRTDKDEGLMKSMIALYKDGDGEKSKDFGDLTDLDGDTVARFQVAEAETIAKITGMKEQIEKFGKEIDDEDLADMLLDIENVTLDVNFSDDVLGLKLAVDAGSKELAKVVESLFNIVAFANRVYVDAALLDAGGTTSMLRKVGADSMTGKTVAKGIKAAAKYLREAAESDRSGSTATLTYELDTDDLIEALVPAFFAE